jgi:hypothetical protein
MVENKAADRKRFRNSGFLFWCLNSEKKLFGKEFDVIFLVFIFSIEFFCKLSANSKGEIDRYTKFPINHDLEEKPVAIASRRKSSALLRPTERQRFNIT